MRRFILLCFCVLFMASSLAEVQLANIFADHMVIQRDQPIRVWGKGEPGENIHVKIGENENHTIVNKDSTWILLLKSMPAGGPVELQVSGNNRIVVTDILLGDVWVCGGQSNMEWTIIRTNNYERAVKNANSDRIRFIKVPKKRSFSLKEDIQPTKWKKALGDNILNFSAVGYYFGQYVHKEIGVPIGLISSNWGGTKVESWMSEDAISNFKDYDEDLEKIQSISMDLDDYEKIDDKVARQKLSAYYPENDKGIEEAWYQPEFDDSDWKEMEIPTAWEDAGLEEYDGVVWFRKKFKLTEALKNKRLFLRLGYINDFDVTWINGHRIGETLSQKIWRTYRVPAKYLNPDGENVIAVRVFDYGEKGGLDEARADKISFDLDKWKITDYTLRIDGTWKYQPSLKKEFKDVPLIDYIPLSISPNDYPCLLYNGMIGPITNFAMKGVIWYQGESNAKSREDAIFYRELFPAMIEDWRTHWNQEFPFLFVQLANFRKPAEQPVEGFWPYLRESQLKALNAPKTGMAVIIDIGDADDIHPRNKLDVSKRLGLAAMNKAYGKELVYSGPIYKTCKKKKNGFLIEFDHVGSGLVSQNRYGYINGFTIAGSDSQFVWAKAEIVSKDKIFVHQDGIKSPIAVRYGWADNPSDLCLYNKEGLPASPFRTDDWVDEE